jgi:hypothetical protein
MLPCVHSTEIGQSKYTEGTKSTWGLFQFMELSVLKGATAGWLVNDTLVIKADVTVEREDRFQLDTGASPHPVLPRLCAAKHAS